MTAPALTRGYEVVIGLETHAQLSTASKIFSGASTAFGAAPNTQACAIDLALPGTLPVMNRGAVERAICFQKPQRSRPGFWIVSDTVRGAGRHAVTALFHYHPDNAPVVMEGRSVRTTNADANLLILALGDGPLTISRYRGQEVPFRGWFSGTYGNQVPADEVEFVSESALPQRRDFLLLPSRGATVPEVKIEQYESAPDGAGIRLKIVIGRERFEVLTK